MSAQNLSSPLFKEVYRGVTAGGNWRNDVGQDEGEPMVTRVPDPIKEQGGVHFGTGIGVHWTDRRLNADEFANPQENPKNVPLSTIHPTSAIIHAKVAKRNIASENNPMRGPVNDDLHILDYKEENENTIQPNSTVHVTKVEKFRQSGKKRERRYNPPRRIKT